MSEKEPVLSKAETEDGVEKKTYTAEEVSDILARIGDMTDRSDEKAEQKLVSLVEGFWGFVNRQMEFSGNGNNLREVITALNEKMKSGRPLKNDDGSIMSLEDKIDKIGNIADLVFKEGKVKNPQQ